MYDQMYNDINRHILVVWQSVGVLIGAFAIFALAEKAIVPVDIATGLILLTAGWLLAHLVDAAYWYNRNLAIISNIERQFLVDEDLRNIHYYFGSHRPNTMLTHLRIQFAFGVGISLIVLFFHFSARVYLGMSELLSHFEPARAIPYIIPLIGAAYLRRLRRHRDESYAEFLKYSPGRTVDTSHILYGVGHGHPEVKADAAPRAGSGNQPGV